MQIKSSLVAVALGAAAASALRPLERNLAYRSPSKTIGGSGLAYDIDGIGHSIIRRSLVKRSNGRSSLSARDTLADDLVREWDGDIGPDGRDAYKGDVSFPFSVASGDPYQRSAILWTHPVPADENTEDPVCLKYQTTTRNGSWSQDEVADYGYAWTTSDVDYSFKVETSNLQPRTEYFYRFQACHDDELISPVGQFKTMPEKDDDSVDQLKIAVFSCSNYPFGYFHSYTQAAMMEDVDYAVHVGDYIYEYQGDGNETANTYGDGRALDRVPQPNGEIFTLEDYRQRYMSYRSDQGLRDLHQRKAWLPVPDDHEIADNAWKGGSANSNNTEAGTYDGVTFTDRKRNAIRAYFEWMPIRQVDTTDSLRIWRSFHYGKLADILALDTRTFERDLTDLYYNTDEVAAISNDTDRSLMGGKQERWLYQNLIKSQTRGATWKIVAQQVIVNILNELREEFNTNWDQWDGYRANRRRMFETITSNNIDNVLFLAGDSHAAWAYDTITEQQYNDTSSYDPSTGRGSLAVEFAGTAVSSPSSYGRNLTSEEYLAQSRRYVQGNRNLQFAEGDFRGYFTLTVTPEQATADFYSIRNITSTDPEQFKLATFEVARGANHITRPVNNGEDAPAGALQAIVVDYEAQPWNGTFFA